MQGKIPHLPSEKIKDPDPENPVFKFSIEINFDRAFSLRKGSKEPASVVVAPTGKAAGAQRISSKPGDKMDSNRLNCWEYMKCGRQPGGKKAAELGVCPAATDASFSGINSGNCAGRFCWAVAGTFCGGNVQGTFAEKRESCINCVFFKLVQTEEGTANLRTKLLQLIPENEKHSLLNKLAYKHIKSGERFLNQGEVGDAVFIIQRGSCIVLVEKDGILHPVGHRGEGDIIDMMTILTGESRRAHFEAETDMEVWVLNKARFDKLFQNDSEVMNFLTELVVDRLDSRRPIADRTIGKYIATDIIGRGGYSIVYKGVHSGLAMPVAIKMMRHDLAMNVDFLKNFRNEAKIIAGLNHDNIIRVYDIEERFRTVFIIMEYLEGEIMRDLLMRLKKIPPVLAADFLFQVCSGLAYAHLKGIIHRDINTANIFVQNNNRVKLFDFGLACPIGTEDFMLGGAFPYLAPELYDGEPADQRSDIYALGITAFEIVVGKRPYPEETAGDLMKRHRTQDILDPAQIIPEIPEALRRFIIKACRRNPAERYPRVSEALEEIRPLAEKISMKNKYPVSPKRKTSNVSITYRIEQRQKLNRILKDFSIEMKKLGIDVKTENFDDR
jgi:eukaryotic-like serine/threonine-protein kinase